TLAATLCAVGCKSPDGDAQRYAGLAAVAVGPVGEHAAAPEAQSNQLGISIAVNQVAGGGHLRTGGPPGDVTARIRRRGVELKRLEWKVLEVRHADAAGLSKSSVQYTGSKVQMGAARRCACLDRRENSSRGMVQAPMDPRWGVSC